MKLLSRNQNSQNFRIFRMNVKMMCYNFTCRCRYSANSQILKILIQTKKDAPMNDLDTLQLDEKLHLLIQKIVRAELQKLQLQPILIGVSGEQLAQFSGLIENSELMLMSEAIEAECRRVEVHEW